MTDLTKLSNTLNTGIDLNWKVFFECRFKLSKTHIFIHPS